MRTNIELDDHLVREAKRLTGAKTKRSLIEQALTTLIEVKSAERRREEYGERLRSVQSKLSTVRLRENPSDILRQDRSR